MPPTYVSLDLETTGLRLGRDEIVEIAAVKFRGETVLDTWHTLVRPSRALPHSVRRLTGIRPADLAAAPPLDAVKQKLLAFVGDARLVGQSIQGDIDFLAQAGLKLSGVPFDTFELASLLLPELSDYSLAAVAAHYGIAYPERHRALPDAEAARRVFTALQRTAEALDLSVLAEITRLLRRFDDPRARALFVFFSECEAARARAGLGATIGARLAAARGADEANFDFLLRGAPRDEPLRPRDQPQPVDVPALAALLEPDGALAASLPGYEHRPEQVTMLRGVGEALNDGEHLLVEAATGVGKSLAYLLPAMAYARRNNAPVVISTHTINLQDQLIGKDIPDLQRALAGSANGDDPELRVAVLKGRTNYLCLRRWTVLRTQDALRWDEAKLLLRTLIWLPRTASGDREELNLGSEESFVWSRVSAQADECLASSCSFLRRGTCFLFRARRQAERAHLVVVNHALLLSDLQTESQLIPEYDHLIIDEAHHLEEVATSQFGFQVGSRELAHFLDGLFRRLDGERTGGLLAELPNYFRGSRVPMPRQREIFALAQEGIPTVELAARQRDALLAAAARFLRDHAPGGEYERRLRLVPEVRRRAGWHEVERGGEALAGTLASLADLVTRLHAAVAPFDSAQVLQYDDLLTQLLSTEQEGRRLVEALNAVILAPDTDQIHWLAGTGEVATFHAAPLHVGPELDRRLFQRKASVVLTSATLSTGKDFRYMRERLGLADARELKVGSPFDYAASTLLAIPTDLPEPNRPDYQRRVEEALLAICRAAGGRTLVLFTSYTALRQTSAALRAELEREDILVLAHGQDGSRKQLLRSFRDNPRAVLLGTLSFWEGIDIVGDALSVVVITKLPFGVPTDPVYAARSEMMPDPFNQYAVPQSILRFRQGFGRLIRSRADRGAVVILDRRVDTKEYGTAFLRALPRCTERRRPATQIARDIAAWLARPA